MRAIKLDVAIAPSGNWLHDVEQIKRAEQLGFDAVWVPETAHNPFLLLTLAAKETTTIRLGSLGALAFPRSPMVTAQIAWDLARQSDGRFVLGLGTRSRAHTKRCACLERDDPIGQMREYIESLRAIWDTFQTDARLRYRGQHYQFRLMAPFFNPGPIAHPAIPIYLAGDSAGIWQLAGETSQGAHAPPFHSRSYLRDVVKPAVEKGLDAVHRERSEFVLTARVFVISGETDRERGSAASAARERLADYASNAGCQREMSWQGWGVRGDELCEPLRQEQSAGANMAIADDVLRETAIIADPDKVHSTIVERFSGIADRVCLEWNPDIMAVYEAIAASRVRSS